jgi:hypothetical protein
MAEDLLVDADALRLQVREKYRQVALATYTSTPAGRWPTGWGMRPRP